jgi:hypothetical protein
MTPDDVKALFLGSPYKAVCCTEPLLIDLAQDGAIRAAVRLDAAGVPHVEGVGQRTAAAMRHVAEATAILREGLAREQHRLDEFLYEAQPTEASVKRIDGASGGSYTHAVLAVAAAWYKTVNEVREPDAADRGQEILLRAARELAAIEVELV